MPVSLGSHDREIISSGALMRIFCEQSNLFAVLRISHLEGFFQVCLLVFQGFPDRMGLRKVIGNGARVDFFLHFLSFGRSCEQRYCSCIGEGNIYYKGHLQGSIWVKHLHSFRAVPMRQAYNPNHPMLDIPQQRFARLVSDVFLQLAGCLWGLCPGPLLGCCLAFGGTPT